MKRRFVIPAIICLSLVSARAEDHFICPVTRSTPVTFVPPRAFANAQASLYGTEKLFTSFPGNWHTVQPAARGYRIPKIVWGTAVFDLKQETLKSTLTITGHRLDSEPSALLSFDANTAWVDNDRYFITSEFFVPTLGCWEVTGHFHGTDLSIVIDLR